ncbi:RNA polymerase sigma factor [Lysinibacillus yapensis]|uniref:RNA polymerase sigma factor n=1 Tax=Ureibacillus yapensis TaxID=2304605 RepID=A0A396SG82_9BACL|nr:RNA polymerase sigma factor [Lysinibacillus yapensis]RHW37476.1 RNA polymerase sigma factor [Lysinibacillus yapensis]
MTERELFDSFNKDVYRTCYYMLRNAQDAEDLCHDVFVTVFRQDWRNVEHLHAWIMRIVMNQCLNILKRNKSKHEKQDQVRWLHKQTTDSVKSLDAIVLEKETTEEWEELLKQLPEKLMTVVTLRYIGELSINEIADILKIPVGTVKSRNHKALKMMRKKLEHNQTFWLKGEKQYGTH